MLLTIPDSNSISNIEESIQWDESNLVGGWQDIESSIQQANGMEVYGIDSLAMHEVSLIRQMLNSAKGNVIAPTDDLLDSMDQRLIESTGIVASTHQSDKFIGYLLEWIALLKNQAMFWDLTNPDQKAKLFNLIDHSRGMITMLELQSSAKQEVIQVNNPPRSFTDAIYYQGVTLHSGDIVVSNYRNYLPYYSLSKAKSGYFSSCGIIYVKDNQGLIVCMDPKDDLIEVSLDDYFQQTKSPSIILRPRADLPELISDPILPAKAAFNAHGLISKEIAYDYRYNPKNSKALYSTELIQLVYSQAGIKIGTSFSEITDGKYLRPLKALDVESTGAIMPYEYLIDPRLSEVAEVFKSEWTEIILEQYVSAEKSLFLINNDLIRGIRWKLPFLRVEKGYSNMMYLFGLEGTLPKELSSQAAMTYTSIERRKRAMEYKVGVKAESYYKENGFRPGMATLANLVSQE